MRLGHFESLKPLCPACRLAHRDAALALQNVELQAGDRVIFGRLGCGSCGSVYPIIDGLPVILPDLRRFVSDNLFYLLARDDLPPGLCSVLSDAAGPGSGLDALRQHVSSYAWDHWGDHDPGEAAPVSTAKPGQVARLLAAGLEGLPAPLPEGPILDLGCGAGRSTAELAERTGRLVLGIDMSAALARVARKAVVDGRVSYDRRRIGLVFDRRDFPVPAAAGADVWICDALALPFASGSFAMVVALNLLDCLADPAGGLEEMGRVTAAGGAACVATPFDWSVAATPFPQWIGGHSGLGPHEGRGEAIFDGLLGDDPGTAGGLRSSREALELDWHVRLHDRSMMQYGVRMSFAVKDADRRPDLGMVRP